MTTEGLPRCRVQGCGVPVQRRRDGALFHAGGLPDGTEYHSPDLEGPEPSAPEGPDTTPGERMAAACERIADALEKLVEHTFR